MIIRPVEFQMPAQVFAPLNGMPFAHRLCGGAHAAGSWGGDWSIIVALPTRTFEFREGASFIDGELVASAVERCPFEVLGELLATRRLRRSMADTPEIVRAVPFLSGAVGHVSYEMSQFLEPSLDLPDMHHAHMTFGFYDAAIITHKTRSLSFMVGTSDENLDRLHAALHADKHSSPVKSQTILLDEESIQSDKSRSAFISDVRNCIDHILRGDIFQANLTRELSHRGVRQNATALASAFEGLRMNSAADYACLLQYRDEIVISNSPESFFSVNKKLQREIVTAQPIKGTRDIHPDPVQDEIVQRELLEDEKERAENIMIADLVRNDLSRVCKDGSINEDAICELQSFASVHHLVSRISGELREGKSALDVLICSFPCGSVTGAPKLRAMEIIGETEKRARGVYCGAIGFFDDRGGAEFSVPIRTAVAKQDVDGMVYTYGTGGGITALSVPDAEYEETEVKAKSFSKLMEIIAER